MRRLSEREKLILALLHVHGPQPTIDLQKIVYPGQTVWFRKQNLYMLRTLNCLKDRGFVEKTAADALWKITETGINALHGGTTNESS